MSTLKAKYSTYEEENLGKQDIIAHPSMSQALGTKITKKHVNCTTCLSAGFSTTFDYAALPGAECHYVNNGTYSNRVYPKSGDKIEDLAVNAFFLVESTEYRFFKCIVAGTWRVK